jgi:hypothetical protein
LKKNIEIKTIHSPYPFVIAGGIYIVGSFILPMYKFTSYFILLFISIVVYLVIKKMNVFQDEKIEMEIPIVYENQVKEQLAILGEQKVNELKEITKQIDNINMQNDLNEIIKTSEAILDCLSTHKDIEGKVKKYFRYYLDEIIHITKQYDEVEDDTFQIENIEVSKANIEKTISNANKAFLKFYNELYDGKAMDIDVDLKVFDDMLKKLD